jgi:single-strand DNA-binding protein
MKQNSVQLIGYVGKDPEIKVFNSNVKRACLRVATHYPLKKEGDKKLYGTTWHNIVAWDNDAAYAERSFVKGSHILVEGFIIYNTYPDKEGHIRYTTEIKATSLINLDR